MHPKELRCPCCFAPIDPTHGAISKCRYCGTTVSLQAPNVPLPATPGQLHLEHVGRNAIAVIKVIRNHTGLGLREAKDLVDRAPCVVAEWNDPARLEAFRRDLTDAGARVR